MLAPASEPRKAGVNLSRQLGDNKRPSLRVARPQSYYNRRRTRLASIGHGESSSAEPRSQTGCVLGLTPATSQPQLIFAAEHELSVISIMPRAAIRSKGKKCVSTCKACDRQGNFPIQSGSSPDCRRVVPGRWREVGSGKWGHQWFRRALAGKLLACTEHLWMAKG